MGITYRQGYILLSMSLERLLNDFLGDSIDKSDRSEFGSRQLQGSFRIPTRAMDATQRARCLRSKPALLHGSSRLPWQKVNSHPPHAESIANRITSLGWMEMRTILAKVHYTFDLELVDPSLDWHRDSRMRTLWQKPALPMRIHLRAGRT